jgi:NAD(P)-dependent dehydrogenase (short-subunit alcohol dehydrogenase family)
MARTLFGKVLTYTVLSSYITALLVFRGPDAVEVVLNNDLLGTVTTLMAFSALARIGGANLATPIAANLFAHYVDTHFMTALDDEASLAAGSVVIITGANSGTGHAAAIELARRGSSTVVMACRSLERCAVAAETVRASAAAGVRVLELELDLGSSGSIRRFAAAAAAALPAAIEGDLVVIANAGFAPTAATPPTADGLEGAVGAMHVGHHYLIRRLLVRRDCLRGRARGAVRVVSVASVLHRACGFGVVARWLGLPDSANPLACFPSEMLADRPRPPSDPIRSYDESKLGNVLLALSLPRRLPDAVDEATAVDLGWVETGIQPFMAMSLRPSALMLMRPAETGVRPIILAALGVPGAPGPVLGEGRLISALGRLVRPFALHSGEAELEALEEPVWAMSERIADKWDALTAL